MKNTNLWANLMRKRRVAIYDNDNEQWHAELSPMAAVAASIAVVTLIFGIAKTLNKN